MSSFASSEQSCVQLILSGQSRHGDPTPASVSGTPVSVTCEGNAVLGREQHLRIYHEYLSYLFRKPEPPTPQQQLEMGYRDYLQVVDFSPGPESCSLAQSGKFVRNVQLC